MRTSSSDVLSLSSFQQRSRTPAANVWKCLQNRYLLLLGYFWASGQQIVMLRWQRIRSIRIKFGCKILQKDVEFFNIGAIDAQDLSYFSRLSDWSDDLRTKTRFETIGLEPLLLFFWVGDRRQVIWSVGIQAPWSHEYTINKKNSHFFFRWDKSHSRSDTTKTTVRYNFMHTSSISWQV